MKTGRIFMAMGPGDVVADHALREGDRLARGETSITFSRLALAVLHARKARALLVSHNRRVARFDDGLVESRNVPRWGEGAGGPVFHLSRIVHAIRLAWMARRFGADVAIIDSGSAHYFALVAFRLLGIPVAVNLHNVRWPQGYEPGGAIGRLLRRLDSWFFRRVCVAGMGCSPACADQMRADGAGDLPYFGWTGQFSAVGFDPQQAPDSAPPFRVAFVGRIERNKGVFDILAMARDLSVACPVPVRFDICGDGTDLVALREAAAAAGLEDRVHIRGRLERAELLDVYRRSHAIIVPTRSDFCEGMPLVCAEAALSGRPVITSRLSNALPVVGPMIVEAEPEAIADYVAAITRLATDPALWGRLHDATQACRAQFLDRSKSYAAAIDAVLTHLSGEPPVARDYAALIDGTAP